MPGFYEVSDGEGVADCPQCGGRGHLIGVATTTAAQCDTCRGFGKVRYRRCYPAWPWMVPQAPARTAGGTE
jgi:hypothetical protein